MVPNNYPGVVSEEWKWYPLQRLNPVPPHVLENRTTQSQGHPALTSTIEPILVVTIRRVAETFKIVIDQMTSRADFKQVNLSQAENVNLSNDTLNTSVNDPENRWNIALVSHDTLTSGVKPSTHSQLTYSSWSVRICDVVYRYKTKNSVGWQIAKKSRIGSKLQITATPGFQSQYDWGCQMTWLFLRVP